MGQAEPQTQENTMVQQEPLCRLRPSDPPPHRRHVRPRASAHTRNFSTAGSGTSVHFGADGLLGDAHDAADVAVIQAHHSRVNSPTRLS